MQLRKESLKNHFHPTICGVEILLPRIDYTHEIVNTHEGALLQERAPKACSGSETVRVYQPL